jgi:hypothetical protein
MKKNPALAKKQALNEKLFAVSLKRELDKAYEDGNRDGFYNCMTVMLWELRNVYGFGEQRLTKIVKKVIDLGDSVDKGLVSVDDIKEQLQAECGILLDWRKAQAEYERTGVYPDWRNQKQEQ